MTITLNHTMVPALEDRQAALFFASITGLRELPPAERHRKRLSTVTDIPGTLSTV